MSVQLKHVVEDLDVFFELSKLPQDPSMKIFVPQAYKNYELPIKDIFEKEFLKSFNGLMIAGDDTAHTIFTSSFPHKEILEQFVHQAQKGDLLFVHHPIPLECGDPKGSLGRGFIPLDPILLKQIIDKKLSVYSCHAPLDYHTEVSTNRAIAKALSAKIESEFLPFGNGFAGLIVSVPEISTDDLVKKLQSIFSIRFVDFACQKVDRISKIGSVAGGGDEVEYSQEFAEKGCQAYITGEIVSRHQSDWAKDNLKKVEAYAKSSDLSLIGVSHSASEYLVMKTLIPNWIASRFDVSVVPLAQRSWWL